MSRMTNKIKSKINRFRDDRWVFSSCDFNDTGDRKSVGRVLARLAKCGDIVRLCRGLYHVPVFLKLTNRLSPASHNEILAAIMRRDGNKIVPHSLYFANGLGLTNAVLAKSIYLYSGRTKLISAGAARILLEHASPSFMKHATATYGPGYQALVWLGKDICAAERDFILRKLPPALLADLRSKSADFPSWMRDLLK
jgi:hypothetical protein